MTRTAFAFYTGTGDGVARTTEEEEAGLEEFSFLLSFPPQPEKTGRIRHKTISRLNNSFTIVEHFPFFHFHETLGTAKNMRPMFLLKLLAFQVSGNLCLLYQLFFKKSIAGQRNFKQRPSTLFCTKNTVQSTAKARKVQCWIGSSSAIRKKGGASFL